MKNRYSLLMSGAKLTAVAFALTVLVSVTPNASADPVPPGWTCTGTCGSLGADGVVPLSPIVGSTSYQYVSTYQGPTGGGTLPTGALGGETNGSSLATSVFTATANTELNFYFDYVTSDGAGFADYAWAALVNVADPTHPVILFTARTEVSGTIVPGTGMPPVVANLTPGTVPITPGATTWTPLGGSSGLCYINTTSGCGNTGWVNADYFIQNAGDYQLEVGVTNWSDTLYDSGLAMDGVTINGQSITATPEPTTMAFLGLAAGSLVFFRRRRTNV